MADHSNETAGTSSIVGQTADRLRAHTQDAADKIKDIGSQASASVGDLKDKASDLVGSAKTMASDAGGKVADALEDQKSAGADRVKSISDAIRRAANELEQDIPPAATYIKYAADEIDSLANAIQHRDMRQLVGTVQDFARRQPAAFLGATVLGGFAIMRLLKAPVTSAAPQTALRSTSYAQPSSETFDDLGAGDPGGISPEAPGFKVQPSKASTTTGVR